jgi:hypothetical protein
VRHALNIPLERDLLSPSSAQLRAALSRSLERRMPRVRIIGVDRAPYPNRSSWWLEEITLDLDDNTRIALIFKDLARETKGSGARHVKPAFVTNPAREAWVYQNLLIEGAPGPPRLWAAVTDSEAGRYWLFLERVNGTPLTQMGDRKAWWAAAEWLGRFHATAPVARAMYGPLLHHDHDYHRRWLFRALAAAEHDAEKLARLHALISAHERAIEMALAMNPSLIHGEFYPSNVLVEEHDGSFLVHPVDWEMAALGPPLLDLAALTSGRWRRDERVVMATAYCEGARSAGLRCAPPAELLLGVAACRLLLAVQWLGWSAEWTAPADHQNDWLEEAEQCERELRA